MAVRNPTLTRPRSSEAPSKTVDYSQVINAGANLAGTILDRKKENVLMGFRNDVQSILDKNLTQNGTPGVGTKEDDGLLNLDEYSILNAQDRVVVSEFATRMDKIRQIGVQGGGSAQVRAMIEAESALREMQAKFPLLATELRQEAALVLGSDPTGTQLKALADANEQAAIDASAEWGDLLEYAYGTLYMDRTQFVPGTAQWYAEFARLEQRYTRSQRIANDLELAANLYDYTDQARIGAEAFVADPGGVFQALSRPLEDVVFAIANLTDQDRLNWLQNKDSVIPVGGVEMSFNDWVANINSAKLSLNQAMASLDAETAEKVAPQVQALSQHYDNIVEWVGDPNRRPDVLQGMLDTVYRQFELGLSNPQKYQLFMVEKLVPYLTLLDSSVFAENLILREEYVDLLSALAGLGTSLATSAPGLISGNLNNQPAYVNSQNSDELAAQAMLTSLLDFQDTLINNQAIDQQTPQEIKEGMVNAMAGMAQYLNVKDTYDPALAEQLLEVIGSEYTIKVINEMAPQLRGPVARTLNEFYLSSQSNLNDTVSFINRNSIPLEFKVTETGEVLVTDPARQRGQSTSEYTYFNNRRADFARQLTRRVRANAAMAQMSEGATVPDYERAFDNVMDSLAFDYSTIEAQP